MLEYDLEDVLDMAHGSGFPALPEVADALKVLYGKGWPEWSEEWSEVFDATRRAKEAVEHLEREAVRLARLNGLSWEEIGEGIGITGQGARKRYTRTDLQELDALDEFHEAEMKALLSEIQLAFTRTRNEMRSEHESEEDLGPAAMNHVANEQGYFPRLMRLIDEHCKARSKLVRQLGD